MIVQLFVWLKCRRDGAIILYYMFIHSYDAAPSRKGICCMGINENKERFLTICRTYIKREGIDKLLEFLCSPQSDFFTAPASTRYHCSYEGGLLQHSLNVYDCLKDYMERQKTSEDFKLTCSEETIAIIALFHDLCKVNCYKVSSRNVKGPDGVWRAVPYYEFDDQLPYGHGEKSVYMMSGYMRLTRDEAFAVRYHVGFASTMDSRNVSSAMYMFPLALALYIADMEATYFLESPNGDK